MPAQEDRDEKGKEGGKQDGSGGQVSGRVYKQMLYCFTIHYFRQSVVGSSRPRRVPTISPPIPSGFMQGDEAWPGSDQIIKTVLQPHLGRWGVEMREERSSKRKGVPRRLNGALRGLNNECFYRRIGT